MECFFEELIAVTDERTYGQNVCATHNYKQRSSPNHLKLKICTYYASHISVTPSSWRFFSLLSYELSEQVEKIWRYRTMLQVWQDRRRYIYSTFCPISSRQNKDFVCRKVVGRIAQRKYYFGFKNLEKNKIKTMTTILQLWQTF